MASSCPPMPVAKESLLTRRELQDELRNFAKGHLRDALQEALKELQKSSSQRRRISTESSVVDESNSPKQWTVRNTGLSGDRSKTNAMLKLANSSILPSTLNTKAMRNSAAAEMPMEHLAIVRKMRNTVDHVDMEWDASHSATEGFLSRASATISRPSILKGTPKMTPMSSSASIVADAEDKLERELSNVTTCRTQRVSFMRKMEQRVDSRDLVMARVESYASLPTGDQEDQFPCCQCEWLKTIVTNPSFERVIGAFVILNALYLGYDTDALAAHPHAEANWASVLPETIFCVIFTVELIMRMIVYGFNFCRGDDCKWNMFDVALVAFQLFEQSIFVIHGFHHTHLGMLHLMRLLRIARIARLLRTFHLFDDLRLILSTLGHSLTSLGWSVLFLAIVVYVASLVFLQIIVAAGKTEHYDEIHYWFSSLFRTFLTMFECLIGGVNWDEVLSPIMSDISPSLAVVFAGYIATCIFAMLNLLTGAFLDKALTSVREDKDVVLAKRIRDLFMEESNTRGEGKTFTEEITWETFYEKLSTKSMKEYFAQINVEVSEARALFDLMDLDGDGTLESHEIVRAILQLRGPARALELAILTRMVYDLQGQVESLEEGLRQILPD